MDVLVGYSGFVGSNLALHHKFNYYFNSKNIKEAYGLCPDVLIYAGVTGTKWFANKFPDRDQTIIKSALENIEKIAPKKLILISTIDVYDTLDGVNEDHIPNINKLHSYGKNRYLLEQNLLNKYENIQIFRLPAIYGEHLKKNFIYDLIHLTPPVLQNDSYTKLSSHNSALKDWYTYDPINEHYKINNMDRDSAWNVRTWFKNNQLNALNFTNNKSSYQFYNLHNLWGDISYYNNSKEKIFNLVTEPIYVEEILDDLKIPRTSCSPDITQINYNLHTKYYLNKIPYLKDKNTLKQDLYRYIKNSIENLHP